MIRHIVMFNLKDTLSDMQEKDILREAKNLGRIANVKNLIVGKNIERQSNYNYLLCVDFDNLQELKAYQVHPNHIDYTKKKFKPSLSDKMVIDFDF